MVAFTKGTTISNNNGRRHWYCFSRHLIQKKDLLDSSKYSAGKTSFIQKSKSIFWKRIVKYSLTQISVWQLVEQKSSTRCSWRLSDSKTQYEPAEVCQQGDQQKGNMIVKTGWNHSLNKMTWPFVQLTASAKGKLCLEYSARNPKKGRMLILPQ